jgi:hypothetical protein
MLIATAYLGDGATLLILGLSRANRERLENGHPMDISQATHGTVIPTGLKIMIFAGETELEMREILQGLIGLDTVIDQRKPI